MIGKGSGPLLLLLVVRLLIACGNEEQLDITGPGLDPGEGRLYPIRDAVFSTVDAVPVSAVWYLPPQSGRKPVVILLHDLDGDKYDWLTEASLFVDLIEAGYAVVALDNRGYGATPLPEGRSYPVLQDLEVNHRDVLAALDWLDDNPHLDASRVALVGGGSGGNTVYVSKGAYPDRIKTAVSISPGLWQLEGLRPVVVGDGISPFTPESILYIVGENDIVRIDDEAGTVLSYVDFARSLHANTASPARIHIVAGSQAHGMELLEKHPDVLRTIIDWLENAL